MRALFTSFPAADYLLSKRFYEQAIALKIVRAFSGSPHRFTNYELRTRELKVYEWHKPHYGSGHGGLFIATRELDRSVERIRDLGVKATAIVVHEWGRRCCSVTDPCGNIFDHIDANQTGQA